MDAFAMFRVCPGIAERFRQRDSAMVAGQQGPGCSIHRQSTQAGAKSVWNAVQERAAGLEPVIGALDAFGVAGGLRVQKFAGGIDHRHPHTAGPQVDAQDQRFVLHRFRPALPV